MTTLIYTGTLFSDWRHVLEKHMPVNSKCLPISKQLSTLSADICKQQFSMGDELLWKPFSPGTDHLERATQLLSSIKNEPVFTWADNNSSLILDFWKKAASDTKFMLFYSSPEYELCNYINGHSLVTEAIEKVITSWINRTRAMLNFFLNHRNDSLLLNIQTVLVDYKGFLKTLNTRLDLDLKIQPAHNCTYVEHSALMGYLATSLLLDNETVSEIYDEVRSTATMLSELDKTIPDIQDRNHSLITGFLNEVTCYSDLTHKHKELETELSLNQQQITLLQEGLETYFRSGQKQQQTVKTLTNYLATRQDLKVARLARLAQS